MTHPLGFSSLAARLVLPENPTKLFAVILPNVLKVKHTSKVFEFLTEEVLHKAVGWYLGR